MKPNRTAEAAYLGLAFLGAVLPLTAFLPWLAAHGLDLTLFIQELFANRISAFFAWDVIVSAIVIVVALALRGNGLTTAQRFGIVAGTVLIGVSVGLPLLLYFQERTRRPLFE